MQILTYKLTNLADFFLQLNSVEFMEFVFFQVYIYVSVVLEFFLPYFFLSKKAYFSRKQDFRWLKPDFRVLDQTSIYVYQKAMSGKDKIYSVAPLQ